MQSVTVFRSAVQAQTSTGRSALWTKKNCGEVTARVQGLDRGCTNSPTHQRRISARMNLSVIRSKLAAFSHWPCLAHRGGVGGPSPRSLQNRLRVCASRHCHRVPPQDRGGQARPHQETLRADRRWCIPQTRVKHSFQFPTQTRRTASSGAQAVAPGLSKYFSPSTCSSRPDRVSAPRFSAGKEREFGDRHGGDRALGVFFQETPEQWWATVRRSVRAGLIWEHRSQSDLRVRLALQRALIATGLVGDRCPQNSCAQSVTRSSRMRQDFDASCCHLTKNYAWSFVT